MKSGPASKKQKVDESSQKAKSQKKKEEEEEEDDDDEDEDDMEDEDDDDDDDMEDEDDEDEDDEDDDDDDDSSDWILHIEVGSLPRFALLKEKLKVAGNWYLVAGMKLLWCYMLIWCNHAMV